jgi:hypothetical protein
MGAYDRSIQALKDRADTVINKITGVEFQITQLEARVASRNTAQPIDPDPAFTDKLLLLYRDTWARLKSEATELINVMIFLNNQG